MRLTRMLGAVAVVVAAALAAFLTFGAGSGSATGPCTKFASPSGSDANSGTVGSPYLTVQRLSDSLVASDVGCLRGGTYTENVGVTAGGSSTADVTITEFPGEEATVVGRLEITSSASHLTIEGLTLVGVHQLTCGSSLCASPTVNANDVSFVGNDVTSHHRAICFLLGDSDGTWGRADRVRIVGNRIHDCGVLPATNQQHGIYAEATTHAVISDNYIYGNADKAINVYPDTDEALITRNVIVGNGHGIMLAGDGITTSDDNVVTRNVISDSNIGFNVASYWPNMGEAPAEPELPITGNVVSHNCVYGSNAGSYYNRNGGVEDVVGRWGYTVSGNVVASAPGPGYVDPLSGDYRLRGTSDCLPLFASTSAAALSTDVPD